MEHNYNKEEIKDIIPQRDPILLVDSARIIAPDQVEGDLYIDPDWDIFRGHFPGNPVLPGVYLIESMAQTADVLLLEPEENRGKIPVFMGVRQVRFSRPVKPGDHLHTRAVKTAESAGMVDFQVRAMIDGKRAASGIITIVLK